MVDFDTCIQPILDARCVGCHGVNGGLSLEPGQAEANLVGVPSTCNPQVLRVKPGDPDSSMLYWKITDDPRKCGQRMPAAGPPLTQEEIQLIRQWITSLSP